MNYLKNITLVLAAATLMPACERDILQTVPTDRLSTEIFWKTERDATLAANGVYTYLDQANTFASGNAINTYFSWDGISDIGHTNNATATEGLIERNQFDATHNRVTAEWTNNYAGIRAANTFLIRVDEVKTTNTALIDRLKNEVRVIRAYAYIRLASLYGNVPLITTALTLEESKQVTRTPVTEVWDFISKELTEASVVLPAAQTGADKGRVTKGAALALKARAMLYAGRYTEAATAAKQVMDLNVYNLYASYERLFTYAAENNIEVILDKQFTKDTYSNNVFRLMGSWSQQQSTNYFVPTKKLADAYYMTNGKDITDPTSGYNPQNPYANRDPRLRYTVFLTGDQLPDGKIYNSKPGSGTADAVDFSVFSTSTGFTLKKYINKEDLAQPANGGINLILIRYAEVLLTYAEAKIEANQIDQTVVDAINKVRQRPDVNMPLLTAILSQTELRAVVRHERLVELAFEGLRYFDIRRWRIAETVVPGTVSGITYTDNNGVVKTIEIQSFQKVFNKSRDYLWPVPQREIELNPTLGQNPNW